MVLSHRAAIAVVLLVFVTAPASRCIAQPPVRDTVGRSYPQGVVTELSKEFITLAPITKEAPKRFVVSDTLAAGEVPIAPRPGPNKIYSVGHSWKYRLTDVRIGDEVQIIYATVGGVDICDHISIKKRPGGFVPPLPKEANDPNGIPYHEYMAAYWNLHDNGIPFPEHFAKYTIRQFPIAPPPREVKR